MIHRIVIEAVTARVDGNDNDEEFEIETLTIADSDDGENEVEVRPRLKRLRRGLSGSATVDLGSVVVDDDDIEDFSSPEDNNAKDEILPTQHYSVSNSSKFPLTGLGVLTRESGKRKQNLSNISNAPESIITNCSKQQFPKLTVSPLRKFQLIDSDSDSDISSISKLATNKTSSFDFDFDDTPEPQTTPNNTSNRDSVAADVKSVVDGNDNDKEFVIETLTVADSDEDNEVRPRLKRLRRGCSVEDRGLSGSATVDLGSVVVDDDDIEDFSSPEDDNAKENQEKESKISHVSNVPESVITSCSKQPLPKLTVSPLRKSQLIDSDSDFDIPSISKVATNKTCTKSEPYLNREQYAGLNQPRKLSESLDTSARKELWEDFRHEKSFHILTPALDEVCDEYFSSMKDKKKALSNVGKSNHNSHVMDSVIDLDDPRLSAHQYFFHNDLRIQELVRIRLCNFPPLNDRGSEQPSTSNIDYI